MEAQFRVDPNISNKTIHEHLLSNYGVEISWTQRYHANKKARENIEGNHGKTYGEIRYYAKMVRTTNLRSVVYKLRRLA